MADFLAEDHEDLFLSQVADAMEYEYILDQAVSDYIPKSETVNFGLNFDLDYLSSWLNDEESVKLEPFEDIASTRFGKPASDEDIKNLVDGQKNCNTDKNTKWALGVFNAWRKERGSDIPELIAMSPESMNFWLSRFIMEARKRDGGDYPPKSLYFISCGLLRHPKDNEVSINFLTDKDFTFTGFRKVMKELRDSVLTSNRPIPYSWRTKKPFGIMEFLDLPLLNLYNTPFSFTVVNCELFCVNNLLSAMTLKIPDLFTLLDDPAKLSKAVLSKRNCRTRT